MSDIIKYKEDENGGFYTVDPLRKLVNAEHVSVTYKIRAKAGCFARRFKVQPTKLFLSVTLGDQLLVEMFTEHPEVAYAAATADRASFSFEGMKIYRVVESDVVEVA